MAFSSSEITGHTRTLEDHFWSAQRPPLHLRDKIREGQRISGHTIDLFFVRPLSSRPAETIEDPIAKLRFIRTRKIWRIFWQRASGRWQSYEPNPCTKTLAEALRIISVDSHHCFFG